MRTLRTIVLPLLAAGLAFAPTAATAATAKPGPTVHTKKVCHTWQPSDEFTPRTACLAVNFVDRPGAGMYVRSWTLGSPRCSEIPTFSRPASVFAGGMIGYYGGSTACGQTVAARGRLTYMSNRGRVQVWATAVLPWAHDHFVSFDFDICRDNTPCTR